MAKQYRGGHAPRILIVGAGLGGLCLAQGLRKVGLHAAVYERDASASARAQGYRISLDARGTRALEACLPERLYQVFDATCGQPSIGGSTYISDGQRLIEDETATIAFRGEMAPGEMTPGLPARGRAVDRLVLRETLLAGLDGGVHFGKEFTRYEAGGTGVQVHFADGTAVTCDVLVAADGVSSRVRQQFLPNLSLMDTGMRWLGGRTLLDSHLRALLPDSLADKVMWVREYDKQWFLAPVFFPRRPNDVAQELWPSLHFTDNDDFLMWALIGFGKFLFSDEQLLGATEAQLHRLALQAVECSHPMLKAFVESASPDRGFSLAIRALAPVDVWPSSRITFVGDAIHASPINGTGANAALEDAALLLQYLVDGQADPGRALDAYQAALLDRIRAMHAGLARWRPVMQRNAHDVRSIGS